MKKIKVKLKKRSYQIIIGAGVLPRLKTELKKMSLGKVAIVVTNPKINRLYGTLLQQALKGAGPELHFAEVPDTEESKSARECFSLMERLADLDRGKGVFVIAFGGGVIGDLAGFCASVYRRGIPYIQIPTTLLAQVDSSIGGKVAIDLPCGKNLVGSFYQPRLVLTDLRFLTSLEAVQIKQALAEIIKYAVIADVELFTYLEEHLEEILNKKEDTLQKVVAACAQIKAKIVEQDEMDNRGKRVILNLGHTTAHALEAASGYTPDYPHGSAVALGMLVAGEIAKQLKLVSQEVTERIETLIIKAGLPTRISGLELKAILSAQAHDKKFSGGKNRFVLPVHIGKVVVKENIPEPIIIKAIKTRMINEAQTYGAKRT